MNSRNLFCFGHRGARGHEPENTLRSVRKALELGADGVEVDVHFVDGQLVVIHDDKLDRTTNGRGRVAGKTFAYLRSLDAGHGERIPTLQEIFDTMDKRAVVNVELKGPGTAAPVVALIADYIRHHGWSWESFIVSSFNHVQLEIARSFAPQLRIGALFMRRPRRLDAIAEQLGAWSIHPSLRCVNETLVAEAHRRGMKVFVFTVNTPKDIAHCAKLGVDGVFSDFPERVANFARVGVLN